jgi:hypothetical protein
MAVTVKNTKRQRGHAKALPRINLDIPCRLYVGHIMSYFNLSHSTVYDHLNKGLLPKPSGYCGTRPYWTAGTVKSALEV